MRKSTIIGAVLIGGIALAGCSPAEYTSEQPPGPGTPPANAPQRVADPAKAETEAHGPAAKLLLNREQLNQLAELAEANAQSPQIKQLAAELSGQLDPQLAELNALATEAPEPPESNLGGTTGAAFDPQWKREVRELVEKGSALAEDAKAEPQLREIAGEIISQREQLAQKLDALG